MLSRGAAACQAGRYGEAVGCFESVLDKEPSNHTARYNLAYVHEIRGHIDLAISLYQECLIGGAVRDRAYLRLPSLLEGRCRLKEARSLHLQAVQRRPDKSGYLHNYAGFLSRTHESNEAAITYRTALECEDCQPGTWVAYARHLTRLGETTLAEAVLKDAAVKFEGCVDVHLALADVHFASQQVVEARQDLLKAHLSGGCTPDWRLRMALVHLQLCLSTRSVRHLLEAMSQMLYLLPHLSALRRMFRQGQESVDRGQLAAPEI